MSSLRFAVVALLLAAVSAHAQEKKSAPQPIDKATVAAYEKLGAIYGIWATSPEGQDISWRASTCKS